MVLPSKESKLNQEYTFHKKRKYTNFKCPKINFGELKAICRKPIKDFHSFGKKVRCPNGKSYYFQDNNADILLVAHLDSVLDFKWSGVLNINNDTEIYSSSLDDRLGVYTIEKLLKKANLKYDILYTEGEEERDSTARFFDPPTNKKYKWIASFDRAGTDFVMYQYKHNRDAIRSAESVGFRFSNYGSYSDIRELEHLGVCAFNFGIGYHNYHTERSYASLKEYKLQVGRFIEFFQKNNSITFKHTPLYNSINKYTGLSYDPKEASIFNEEELAFAYDLYEKYSNGYSVEAFNYLQNNTMSYRKLKSRYQQSKIKNLGSEDQTQYGPELKHNVYTQSKVEVANEDGVKVGLFITHPDGKPASQIVKEAEKDGYDAKIINQCLDCGKDYYYKDSKEGNYDLAAFCPECLEKKKSEHIKDKSFAKSAIIYDLATKTEKRSALENYKKDPNPKTLGTLLKELRMAVPEEEVIKINKFLKGKNIKFAKQQKEKDGLFLTQRLMGRLCTAYDLNLSERVLQFWPKERKIISKMEIGNEEFYKTNPGSKEATNSQLIYDYVLVLAQHLPVNEVEKAEYIINNPIPCYKKGLPENIKPKEIKKIIKVTPLLTMPKKGEYELTHVTSSNGKKVDEYMWTYKSNSKIKLEVK